MIDMTPTGSIGFACPKCRCFLRAADNKLTCSACGRAYPIVGGIPDFLSEDLLPGVAPNYRAIKMLEFLAPVYEGQLWHSFILRFLAGASHSSLGGIADFVSETLVGVSGAVLDVACGPATYGRRIASPARQVFGIDFSMGTLQQGLKNIARDQISGIRLARARVEELPFEDAVFDGAICGGSLHLFPDTHVALCEIARTLKAGAPLAVTTFIAGNAPLTYLVKRRQNMHVFELSRLQQELAAAGFEGFQSSLDGTFVIFRVRKAVSASTNRKGA